VALARVHGVTGRRLSRMEMLCGGFDTGLFCEQCELVADDPAIHTLVIDFDSPGGLAAGSLAAAQAILAVGAAGKRTVAYASGDCCSAAYFMAAACDEIHADPEARVGSISTVCHGVDTSREWEKKGWELKLFATGKFKATGMPGKAWTEEEEAMMWERVRQFDGEFKGFVKARRPAMAAESMEGQWWNARHAPAGVVDSLDFPSLQLLVESIFARRP
jgi:ClpP class serine protease